jgi:hypothetical protein
MNLQDFACAISDLIWGGELGWDRENGLEELFASVKSYVKGPKPGYRYEDLTPQFRDIIDGIEDNLKTSREAKEYDEWRDINERS